MVTNSGVYYATDQMDEITRYDTEKGKRLKNAKEITGLFTWTGYVCNASLDLDENGVIDVNDVPSSLDADTDIDEDDLNLFLIASCDYYENRWVFDVADLVVQSMNYTNDGAKTLHIRFYPRSTTTFESNVPQ